MLVGTLTLAFSAIKSDTGRQVMQGMVTGMLAIDPAMVIISDIIYAEVAECNSYGDPTPDFPNGHPIYDKDLAGCAGEDDDVCNTKGNKCDPEGANFLLAYNLIKICIWLFTFASGKLATIFSEKMLTISSAMSGATLTLAAVVDLIAKIIPLADPTGRQGLEAQVMLPLLTISATLTYALTGAGFVTQMSMVEYNRAFKKGKRGKDLPALSGIAKLVMIAPPILVCFAFMTFLESKFAAAEAGVGKLNKLKDGLEKAKDMAEDAAEHLETATELVAEHAGEEVAADVKAATVGLTQSGKQPSKSAVAPISPAEPTDSAKTDEE